MAQWHEIGRRVDRVTRRLAATLIRATSLASFLGNLVALIATNLWRPAVRMVAATGVGYRFFYLLSGRCVGLALGCLLAGWLLSRWDHAVGDDSRVFSHRRVRFLNLVSLILALFIPALATRW